VTDEDLERRGAPTFDSARLKQVMGHFCTGVTIVTAVDDGEPVGFVVQSFQSLSLEPALVLFSAQKTSSTWPRIETSGKWAANILDEDGEEVCRLFAQKGADRFARIAYSPGRTGSPILEDALAFVDCETIEKYDAGDHLIVVGRVIELGYQHEGKPLLFYRGGYGRYEI